MPKKITLLIEKLELEAIIGLLDNERKTPQKIEVWAKISVDYKKGEMIDYVVIRDVIKDVILAGKFFTIEKALIKVSKKIGKINPHIRKLYLKILKPSILVDSVVGASIKKNFKKI